MIKKYQKEIMELILVSVIWLAPAIRALFDYRTVVSAVSFVAVMLIFCFVKRKGYAFIGGVAFTVASCLVNESSLFTVTIPLVMLFISRYFTYKNKVDKKNYDSINPLLTCVVILFLVQTVTVIIKTPVNFDFVWKSKVLWYTGALSVVFIFPFIAIFRKNNTEKYEKLLFRTICLFAVYGILITSYYFLLKNGFYNHSLYVLKLYPWFVFVYTFVRDSTVYRISIFRKAEHIAEKFVDI